MISENVENKKLTLKLISDTNNEYIVKENGVISLISAENAFYMYFNNEDINDMESKSLRILEKKLGNFIKDNKHDLNIDVNSFLNYFNDNLEKTFRYVLETVLFENHKKITYKKSENNDISYNFIFESKWKNIYEESILKMEFVNFARDLQDLPPNYGTAPLLADKIVEKANEIENLKCTVYTKTEIEKMGMGLLLAVNAASEIEPRVVVLEYCGDSSKQKTALVGKGITFDSGGYDLKPSNYMKGMKFDMSGAAIMLSTVMALAKAKAKANVMAIGMFTDNRIGGHGTLTESIITSYSGKTVQIDNTDAEGRLVLADGITYSLKNGNADQIIESSTLTGSIVIALANIFTGVFTHSDKLWSEISSAAESQTDLVWRMPIIPEHLQVMKKTPLAELTNAEPGNQAGSSTAAAFLNEFAEGKPYVHLDIAGTADDGERGRGIMIKTLFEMLK